MFRGNPLLVIFDTFSIRSSVMNCITLLAREISSERLDAISKGPTAPGLDSNLHLPMPKNKLFRPQRNHLLMATYLPTAIIPHIRLSIDLPRTSRECPLGRALLRGTMLVAGDLKMKVESPHTPSPSDNDFECKASSRSKTMPALTVATLHSWLSIRPRVGLGQKPGWWA